MGQRVARESASDPPFSLFMISVVMTDSNRQKTKQRDAVNCRAHYIARRAVTIFNVEATVVGGEHCGT